MTPKQTAPRTNPELSWMRWPLPYAARPPRRQALSGLHRRYRPGTRMWRRGRAKPS